MSNETTIVRLHLEASTATARVEGAVTPIKGSVPTAVRLILPWNPTYDAAVEVATTALASAIANAVDVPTAKLTPTFHKIADLEQQARNKDAHISALEAQHTADLNAKDVAHAKALDELRASLTKETE